MIAAHLAVASLGLCAWLLDRLGVAADCRRAALRAVLLLAPALLWAGASLGDGGWAPPSSAVEHSGLAAAAASVRGAGQAAAEAARVAGAWWALLPAIGLLRLVARAWALWRLVAGTRVVGRVGRVRVAVGPTGASFVAGWPGGAVVVIDAATWARRGDRALALRHELQHLRSGDGAWAWGLSVVEAVLFPNPAASWLARHMAELDELCCDAALVARSVDRARYAGLLLRAAGPPVPAPGLGASALRRRVEMVLDGSTGRRVAPVWLVVLVGLALSAAGSAGQAGAAEVREAPPAVAARLEHMLASTRGREWLARGLEGYAARGRAVEAALTEAGLPRWLAAVPLVESAYQDLPPEANRVGAAGMWQFMPETARRYGLVVDGATDERLDAGRATAAAVRLLADLHAELGDWGLALSAYHVGAGRVHAAVAAEGTRDVVALVEAGALPPYALDVAAAAVALRRPGRSE